MKISLIAAMSSNRVIGANNGLPWHLSADLKHFRQLTVGHCLIMGRKTYDSVAAIAWALTIVVTRRINYHPDGVVVVGSIEEALKKTTSEEVFVAGGGEIFVDTIDRADRMYLTVIDHEYDGDAFFPEFDANNWRVTSKEEHQPDEKFPYPFTFYTYDKA